MRRWIAVLVVAAGCVDASRSRPTDTLLSVHELDAERSLRCDDRTADGCAGYEVPLVQLVARPLQFQGRPITTQGYARLGTPHLSHLYVTRTERQQGLVLGSIALVFDSDSLEQRLAGREGYVTVTGIYDTLTTGESRPYGFWTTGIRVRRIRPLADSSWVDWIDPTYAPKVMR